MEKICELLGSFCPEWNEALRKESEVLINKSDGTLKDCIDSIVANRNQIAHGRDVGLTISRMKKYYDKVDDLIVILDDLIKR